MTASGRSSDPSYSVTDEAALRGGLIGDALQIPGDPLKVTAALRTVTEAIAQFLGERALEDSTR